MSPRDPFLFREEPPVVEPCECAGCGADCDPDGLCDDCRRRREETGEHHPDCRCGARDWGCVWHLATDQRLRAMGLKS